VKSKSSKSKSNIALAVVNGNLNGKSCSNIFFLISDFLINPFVIDTSNPLNILYNSEIIINIGNDILYLFFFCNDKPNWNIIFASD